MSKRKLVVLLVVGALSLVALSLSISAATALQRSRQLRPGDIWVVRVTLRAGVTYQISIACSSHCDFDLYVFDENENLVGASWNGRGSNDVVTIRPRWTGPFYIVVHGYSGCGFCTLRVCPDREVLLPCLSC